MKHLLFICTFFLFSFCALAQKTENSTLNLKDKSEVHSIKIDNSLTGKLFVTSEFIGEPVGAPVKIKFTAECTPPYELNTEYLPQEFSVYDYGNSSDPMKLSDYSTKDQKLTVYYRLGEAIDGKAVFEKDGDRQKTFDLKQLCQAAKL